MFTSTRQEVAAAVACVVVAFVSTFLIGFYQLAIASVLALLVVGALAWRRRARLRHQDVVP